MAAKPAMTEQERAEIKAAIRSGDSMWAIVARYQHLRQHDIRAMYWGIHGSAKRNAMPPEDEMKRLQAEVQAKWTPQDWGNRWVGKYAGVAGGDLQRAASKLLPY